MDLVYKFVVPAVICLFIAMLCWFNWSWDMDVDRKYDSKLGIPTSIFLALSIILTICASAVSFNM